MRFAQWNNIHRKPQYGISNIFLQENLSQLCFFVENASKRYYVTTEIMKRWYLFDIMLLLVGYVFRYIKNSLILSIFCCFYTDFTGLSKKCWCQHILEEWLRQLYGFCSYWNFAVWAAIERNKKCGSTLHWYFSKYI